MKTEIKKTIYNRYTKEPITYQGSDCYDIKIDDLIEKLTKLKNDKYTHVGIMVKYDEESTSYKLTFIDIYGYYMEIESDYHFNLRLNDMKESETRHAEYTSRENKNIENDIKKDTDKKTVDEYKKYLKLKEKYEK